MKNSGGKTVLAVLTLLVLGLVFTWITSYHLYSKQLFADTQPVGCTQDLSYTRKTYVSSDNIGYSSTNNQSSPFGSNLTSISVGSNTLDSFTIDSSSKNVPVVKINNAKDFIICINFSDKHQESCLQSWSTNNRPDKNERTRISEKYYLSCDSWGENNGQTVYANGLNVTTGKISTGALVVQTSSNGDSWTNMDKSKYSNGLYSTDLLNYYHGTSQNYTLDGSSIKKGSYVSISFFYEVRFDYTNYYTTHERYWYQLGFIGGTHKVDHYEDGSEYRNICESYTFYVVEDNVDVVTFNNLTTVDKSEIIKVGKPTSSNPEKYQIESEQYNNYLNTVINQITDTMYDGDMTTSGFKINVTSNPYLNVSVKRNGIAFQINQQSKNSQIYYEVTQPGKYDIEIKSYSKQKNLTIYVDSVSADAAFIRYFGNKVIYAGEPYGTEFLDYSPNNPYGNRRIFDANSDVPVFIGSLTLNLKKQTDTNALGVYGVITNKSTGGTTMIGNNQIKLTEYGEYEVLFSTNANYYESVILNNANIKIAGDVRVYQFKFKLVGQDSGRTVNEQLLSTGKFKEFSMISPSDYAPKFYGVKRSSGNKGEVIVAFADRESALKYAKQVVWGEIETHKDVNGKTYWLVPNLENPLAGKVESYSGWKNAQVIKELSERMVEERYFDLTKSSSYLTLEKSAVELDQENVDVSKMFSNLELEALKKSVIVWYDLEQRNSAMIKQTNINETNIIKFIGKQNYALLTKDEQNVYSHVETGDSDYFFIKDIWGIDSYTVTTEDSLGNQFTLNYEQGLFDQLTTNNCTPGLVLITEVNVYSIVTAQYYVYFIPDNYQPANITFLADGQSLQLDQNNSLEKQTFNYLKIENITDYFDPFAYIRITNKNSYTPLSYHSINQAIDMEFTATGDYEIAIIDRFGNYISYEFSIDSNKEVAA